MKKNISMMAYNVENLFDAVDDGEDQLEVTFLPLAEKQRRGKKLCASKAGFFRILCQKLDWTDAKYQVKLKKISEVLLDYEGGADIIVFEELENRRVLEDLWVKYLIQHGYRVPIHFESPDSRGIDVGMISRFPLTEDPIAHPVYLGMGNQTGTRDILEATFDIGTGQRLRVAANHWPSQANSTKARMKAANVVKTISKKAAKDGVSFIAAGDFNTILAENPNPIQDNIADNDLDRMSRSIVDLHCFLEEKGTPISGTHFYKGHMSWDALDRILVSKDLFRSQKTQVDLETFEVFAPDYLLVRETLRDPRTNQLREYTIPYRYDFFNDQGYSDHLPLVLKLNLSSS
ncbi:MAG: endonuclease/exonuclease/phosphatase family protein [Deltaproteobacteria bacterium]|nr:endonuclease/exonuclease/phosphatase family protein [Deltaproteobacteria bacterium]